MSKPILYALDFDGVICDSAIETSITGWKAAREHFWPKMPEYIPDKLIEQFKFVRPALETGYEAILMVRLLFEGLDPETLLNEFHQRLEGLIRRDEIDTDNLKRHFGDIRDQWITDNLADWLAMNPLFPGVKTKLAALESNQCFIITTKQERFVEEILSASSITIPRQQIFGLERNLSKQQVLRQLQNDQPDHQIVFLEDRLPTLINILDDHDLKEIKLILADWGYNTAQDKITASEQGIKRLSLEAFVQR